ncbi:unnamed protein product [Callosobruchus maculatus]|uniref:Uncharacterized protein n=1 Tax=Callosobruchus maculatus TaxID=64391 RepID=A0A653CS90_CALMS|nr:unnamed protein product [Callosobruchus maculatus]
MNFLKFDNLLKLVKPHIQKQNTDLRRFRVLLYYEWRKAHLPIFTLFGRCVQFMCNFSPNIVLY